MASDPNPVIQARRELAAEFDAERASRRVWLFGFAILATAVVLVVSWKVSRHLVAFRWLAANDFEISWEPEPGPWKFGGSTTARYTPRWRQAPAADLSHLKNLHRLVDLDLSNLYDIGDDDLMSVGELTSLKRLYLGRTGHRGTNVERRLTDETLARIGRLSQLNELQFGGNAITDAGLASLAGLNQLNSLDVQKTPITDVGLESLKALPALTDLDVTATKVTAQGIAAFKAARPTVKILHDGTDPEAP